MISIVSARDGAAIYLIPRRPYVVLGVLVEICTVVMGRCRSPESFGLVPAHRDERCWTTPHDLTSTSWYVT
jgi:hypothetical protein